jgi:hypothetical protein
MITEEGKRFLDLLFDDDEEICVSPNQFGYESIPKKEMLMGSLYLEPNNPAKQGSVICSPSDIQLVSINPIKGKRNDENVSAFRSFLVEMDTGNAKEQFDYINEYQLPYSACVYSGGKSLHFAVTLSEDLPSEKVWRFYDQWILNIISQADQVAKNPSRGMRMAGNIRKETGKQMKLIQTRKRIPLEDLKAWLSRFKELEPKEVEKNTITQVPEDVSFLPNWVQNDLIYGIDASKGRNNRWFSIAFVCGLHGWDEDATIGILRQFFAEERDFTVREWEMAVKSGVRTAKKNQEFL